MSEWIDTDEGYVNASHIERISYIHQSGRGVPRSVLRLTGGGTVTAVGSVEDISARLSPVIPASTGYFLLHAIKDEDDVAYGSVVDAPIIAWRICEYGPRPITIDDDEGVSNPSAIRYPDGRVCSPGERDFANTDEWLAYLNERPGGEK